MEVTQSLPELMAFMWRRKENKNKNTVNDIFFIWLRESEKKKLTYRNKNSNFFPSTFFF